MTTLWLTNSLLLEMSIEIVELPMKNGVCSSIFVCLPKSIMWLGNSIRCFFPNELPMQNSGSAHSSETLDDDTIPLKTWFPIRLVDNQDLRTCQFILILLKNTPHTHIYLSLSIYIYITHTDIYLIVCVYIYMSVCVYSYPSPTIGNHEPTTKSQGLVSKAVGPAAVTAWKERQKSSSLKDGAAMNLDFKAASGKFVTIHIYIYICV